MYATYWTVPYSCEFYRNPISSPRAASSSVLVAEEGLVASRSKCHDDNNDGDDGLEEERTSGGAHASANGGGLDGSNERIVHPHGERTFMRSEWRNGIKRKSKHVLDQLRLGRYLMQGGKQNDSVHEVAQTDSTHPSLWNLLHTTIIYISSTKTACLLPVQRDVGASFEPYQIGFSAFLWHGTGHENDVPPRG